MSKKVMIILMTLLTSSLLGGINTVYAQEVDENKVTAENLLSMLIESKAEVTSLFNEIIDNGGDLADKAEKAFTVAQALHEEAESLFDEGSYEECLEKATDALNEYGKALEIAQEAEEDGDEEVEAETEDEEVEVETEEAEEETEEEVEEETEEEETEEETENMFGQVEGETFEEQAAKMIGLLSNVDKFKTRITVLRGIADNLELAEDTEEYRLLDEAYGILENIRINFEDLDESDIVLGEAVRLISKTSGMLKNKGQPKKEEKFEQFMVHTMNRIEKMKNKMTSIMEKKGSPVESSQTILAQYNDIYTQLEGIDSKEDLREAVKQLTQLIKETRKVGKGDDDSEEIFSEEALESVEDQMTVEEQIEAYTIIVEEMSEDNPVKAEIVELLAIAENLLDEAESAISEEDEELANQKVDEAEEILEAVKELLAENEGHGKGVKPDQVDMENGKSNGHGKDDESIDESTEESEEPEEIEEPEDPETN